MIIQVLVLTATMLHQAEGANSTPSSARTAAAVTAKDDADPAALLKVKRIYVDSFGDDPVSKEMQSMIVSALVASKRFKVTENRERADATLKGVALERSSQETHAFGESTAVRNAAVSDSSAHTETIDRARLALRLVNSDGDVIWTTTQESKGGKYKGAGADVADMCVKQLLRDVAKIEPPSTEVKTQ